MTTHASRLKSFGISLLTVLGLGVAVPGLASEMKYSATLVTDIKVGDHRFHNAAVTFTFVGDTKDIASAVDNQGQPITSTLCKAGTGWFFWLAKGRASFSVHSQGRALHGRFEPDQVFVALDACNGGIGFGSYTGPKGLEVAYPVAYTLGTAMQVALTSGLASPAHMSGNAWSCIGFPPVSIGNLTGSGYCAAPDGYPLHSDVGDVFVYLPYTSINTSDSSLAGNHVGTLNRGTFSITPAEHEE